MVSNIKLNPYFLPAAWVESILDEVVAEFGAPASANPAGIFERTLYLCNYFQTSYLGSQAEMHLFPLEEIASIAVNHLTQDSWCKDCCNQTFNSYDLMKTKIADMGIFNSYQLNYINQLIGMPCNIGITNIDSYLSILSQLETSLIVDKDLTDNDKKPILLFVALSIALFKYWKIQTDSPGSSNWGPVMTPLDPEDYLRSFWLAGLLGAIVCVEHEIIKSIRDLSSNCVNLTAIGVVGASIASMSYAYYR
jgi:hypothetical protein